MKRWPVLGALYFMVNGFMFVFRVLPTCVVQLLLRSEGESSMLYSLLMSMWWRTSQSCQRYVQVIHHMLHLYSCSKFLEKFKRIFTISYRALKKENLEIFIWSAWSAKTPGSLWNVVILNGDGICFHKLYYSY